MLLYNLYNSSDFPDKIAKAVKIKTKGQFQAFAP